LGNRLSEVLDFLRDPLWKGIGSIASIIIIILTYLSLREYKLRERRIERREIFEKIIRPLIKDLEGIISDVPRGYLYNKWRWGIIKSENYYLVLRMNQRIREKIEKFDRDWKRFSNLYHQYYDKLNEIFHNEIVKFFNKPERKWSYKHPKYNARYWTYYWKIGGKNFGVNFFELIYKNKTLKECIEESKNDPEILNKELEDLKCKIDPYEIDMDQFEEIANYIRKKIYENEKFINYFKLTKQIYEKACELKKELTRIK